MPNRHYLTPPQSRTQRLPSWFRSEAKAGQDALALRRRMREAQLHTVCQEAQCPNIWECWGAGTATFMILGNVCTRSCGFCAVTFGRPAGVDENEPQRLADTVASLGLGHVVITSVNRDDLQDGGARVFAACIQAVRRRAPGCAVEVLIPDFQGDKTALDGVLAQRPDILAHNIETVPRLHPTVRPQAKYVRSLQVLARGKTSGLRVKTGLMLGLGESLDEVRAVMRDLVEVGCDILTLGQYLQPTARHLPVARFVHPDAFSALKAEGEAMGLPHVEAGPLVRSSYHAERQAKNLPLHTHDTRPVGARVDALGCVG